MADITMCMGVGCESRQHCYRFRATPDRLLQSWFSPMVATGRDCDYYIHHDEPRADKREEKMTDKPMAVHDGNLVRFGRWYAEVSIRRNYNLHAAEDHGIRVFVGGGMGLNNQLETKQPGEQLLPPECAIDNKEARKIECRIAELLVPVAEKFMQDLHAEVQRATRFEREILEADNKPGGTK